MIFRLTLLLTTLLSTQLWAQKEFIQKKRSIELFEKAAKVFQHPRCLNCHPAGNNPTQGKDLHAHTMNVKRGPDDMGATAMQCYACHGTENNPNSNVPGAPGWKLAPKKMAWQGLSTGDLCRTIKDKKKNGGMSLEELIKHNAEDDLVGWGWKPGGDREPVPGTQAEFGKVVAEWVETGAHCPE